MCGDTGVGGTGARVGGEGVGEVRTAGGGALGWGRRGGGDGDPRGCGRDRGVCMGGRRGTRVRRRGLWPWGGGRGVVGHQRGGFGVVCGGDTHVGWRRGAGGGGQGGMAGTPDVAQRPGPLAYGGDGWVTWCLRGPRHPSPSGGDVVAWARRRVAGLAQHGLHAQLLAVDADLAKHGVCIEGGAYRLGALVRDGSLHVGWPGVAGGGEVDAVRGVGGGAC